MLDLHQRYRAERAKGWPATSAIAHARTSLEWECSGGETVSIDDAAFDALHEGAELGDVRLVIHADSSPYDASFVDTWTDLSEHRRAIEKAKIFDRIEREGVYGIESQVWDGETWESCDSCWGFIGDDWQDSGYDSDIMRAALEMRADLLAPPPPPEFTTVSGVELELSFHDGKHALYARTEPAGDGNHLARHIADFDNREDAVGALDSIIAALRMAAEYNEQGETQ